MTELSDWFQTNPWLSGGPETKLLVSVVGVAIILVARWVLLRIAERRVEDPLAMYRLRQASGYLAFLVAALVLWRVWFKAIGPIATYLGLLSAGVAIALRDPLVNLAAWLFIVWRRPFGVGDRVQVGDHTGDVIDKRIFVFTIAEVGNWVDADQRSGRIIHIPNGSVFTQPLANYSQRFSFIWNELPVMVTFESNWQRARETLLGIAARHGREVTPLAEAEFRQAKRKFMLSSTMLEPTVFTSVADSGVVLTMRYLCRPENRRHSADLIWQDVLTEFAKTDSIDFAYPTRRIYDNRSEAKTITRGPEG